MIMHATWSYPTRIRSGVGRVVEIADACVEAAIAKPLIVTDPGLVDLLPVRSIVSLLSDAGVEYDVFSDLRSNPTGRDVEAGTEMMRRGGHDGVIAIGGGSALDVGKVVAFHAGQSRPLWEIIGLGQGRNSYNHWFGNSCMSALSQK